MNDNANDIESRLLDKSKEAFALAVEIYNRPTLKYHAENCSIILCNAWELMLKAYLVREHGVESIYYDTERRRTLSLLDCLKKIFSNAKDPLRRNMDLLIQFRNLNTHFVTPEYEIIIGPFLQQAVINYEEKLELLHGESIRDLIPENYLALTVRKGLIESEAIHAKYDPAVAQQLLAMSRQASEAVGSGEDGQVAVVYETTLRLVKKAKDADLNVYVDSGADTGVAIIKDVKDTSSYFPYTPKLLIKEVRKRLKKKGVETSFRGTVRPFNMHDFQLFKATYQLTASDQFAYDRSTAGEKSSSWIYSQKAVDLIVEHILEDPAGCVEKMKKHLAENK